MLRMLIGGRTICHASRHDWTDFGTVKLVTGIKISYRRSKKSLNLPVAWFTVANGCHCLFEVSINAVQVLNRDPHQKARWRNSFKKFIRLCEKLWRKPRAAKQIVINCSLWRNPPFSVSSSFFSDLFDSLDFDFSSSALLKSADFKIGLGRAFPACAFPSFSAEKLQLHLRRNYDIQALVQTQK